MKQTLSVQVANTVRAEMARRKVSQRDLAKAIKLTRPTLHRRLHGEIPFDIDELDDIAVVLNIPLTDLLGERAS